MCLYVRSLIQTVDNVTFIESSIHQDNIIIKTENFLTLVFVSRIVDDKVRL